MGADHYFVLLCILLATVGLCSGACPNDCSKRGKCSIENVCICDELYRVAPDCSQRKTRCVDVAYMRTNSLMKLFLLLFFITESCPFGTAWADKASTVDTAHASAECSNLGHCNRKTVSLSFVSIARWTLAYTENCHSGNLRVFRRV